MNLLKTKKVSIALFFLILFFSPGSASAQNLMRPIQVQNVTTTTADIIWKSASGGTSQVKYGTTTSYEMGTANGANGRKQIDNSPGFMHKASITGLSPNTKYFYQALTNGGGMSAAGDQTYYIKTSPVTGSSTPFSWVVIGDSGNGGANQKATATQIANKKPELVIEAGDVVYGSGGYGGYDSLSREPEQDRLHYDIFKESMKFSPYYLACGNHDNNSNNTPAGILNGCDVMVDDQSMPNGGRLLGSSGSGSSVIYSFNYGNVHFTVLNANPEASPQLGGAQLNWAINDIRNSAQPWKVVVWHQNGWSAGTHSTNANVTANLIPMVQDAGAHVVLWGHSHVYERFSRFANQGKAGCTTAGGCRNKGPYYFTIGNSGSGGATGTCGSYANGPMCLARSGVGNIPTGTGLLYAQTNGNSMTFSYVTSSGATSESVTYNLSEFGPVIPPTAGPSPTNQPTSPPNSTPTRTPTPLSGATNTPPPIITQPPGGVCTYYKN